VDENLEILGALEADRVDQALNLYQDYHRRLVIRPLEPKVHLAAGEAYEKIGEIGRAVGAYNRFLRQATEHPHIGEVNFRLGFIYSRLLRDYAKAGRYLREAIRFHPEEAKRNQAEEELNAVVDYLERVFIPSDEDVDIGEPYAIIRQTDERFDITQVGRLVAKAKGIPLAQATREIRRSPSVLVEELEGSRAVGLARRLQAINIPVLVIKRKDLISLPKPQAATNADFDAHGLRFLVAGQVVTRKWEDVFLISGGRVETERREREIEHGPRRYYGVGHFAVRYDDGRRVRYKAVKESQFVVDLFMVEPWSAYRLEQRHFNTTLARKRLGEKAPANFREVVREILKFGHGLAMSKGMLLLGRKATTREWREATFRSLEEFEKYNWWLLQLEEYGAL